MENRFIRAEDVAQELNVSKPYAHSFEEQQEEVATKVNEFLRLNA